MQSLNIMQAGVFGFIGLLVGSFLNVVIYRLPKMMEKQWADECAELFRKAWDQPLPANQFC